MTVDRSCIISNPFSSRNRRAVLRVKNRKWVRSRMPRSRIVEAAEQQHQADGDVGDVGQRDDQLAVAASSARHSVKDALRRAQVLQNIQQQDAVEALVAQRSAITGEMPSSRSALKYCSKAVAVGGLRQQIDAGNAVAVLLKFRREIAFAAADIQNFLVASHHAPRHSRGWNTLLCLIG